MTPMATTHTGSADPSATSPLPTLRDRLVPPMPGRAIWGWLGPLLVTAFAGVLRFDRLGMPHAVVFDETYYAKDALALLNFGVEHTTVANADRLLLRGDTHIWTDGGSFVVHPPLGKWMIAIGEWIFGATPTGWRVSAALVGTLSVLLIARIARRMTRSTLLGCVAGLLLALDGLEFVQSRTALLDIFLMFWVLAAFGCLLVDRDRSRARLVELVEARGADGGGPGLGLRPWRIAAGVCLGLGCATKWDAIYEVAGFGLLTVAWDYGARRAVGVRRPLAGWFPRDAVPAFFSIVGVGLVTYVACWTGWFRSSIGWDRHWADGRASAFSFVPAPLRALWHYHAEIWTFHTNLHQSHPYQSQPWQWLILQRPVAFYYIGPKYGQLGCHVDACSRTILGIGTPAIWWVSLPALVAVLVWWLMYRDWRAGAVVMGVASGWLPWFWFAAQHRTMFFFYALPILPFLVLALTLAIGLLIGTESASPARRAAGSAIAGAYLLLVILNFAYLYPILSAQVIPYTAWQTRMWFTSWI